MKLFFDGGCRPNPGAMETAVVARGLTHLRLDLGRGTSEQAEWHALLQALAVAADLGATDIRLIGDNLSVIRQAKGSLPCRGPAVRALMARYRETAATFARVRIAHVRRGRNLAGIALERARR